jgi:hypothetical protein
LIITLLPKHYRQHYNNGVFTYATTKTVKITEEQRCEF